ncbi:MAG: 4Fe-4S dicluster domain-containing protein [archaeon]
MQKLLPKARIHDFIKNLMKNYEVIAPVKEKITKFKVISSPEEIYLKEITQVPIKQFFLPENETLIDYKKSNLHANKDKTLQRVIFGLRKCDTNALLVLDKIMIDPLYIHKRKKSILIGLYCENPDKYCFCSSMELVDSYDLFFYPEGNNYHISIGSKEGEALVKNLPKAKKEVIKPFINTKVLKNKSIEKDYKNKIWLTDVEKCLSCSACTVYCPTCNCFDISDKLNINLKDSSRARFQASCQLKSFSRVAGGKVFRDSRASRFKHFIYHKIIYYKNKYNKYMCVGCGRCLRVCPTNIDWVNTINLLKNTGKNKK